ncbi:MAG TPA: 16S rRNA (cytosine(1402)-N(4))-methyltransferase RsmH [Acidisarcina sp.]
MEEALHYLDVQPGGTYVDATLGLGGHASAIAGRLGTHGRLVAFDRDAEAMELAKIRLERLEPQDGGPELVFHDVEFSRAAELLGAASVDGLLADFGMSSMQLDQAHRGFSFQTDGPLDMRMNAREGMTAAQVVNQAGEEELANLIYEFGEERRSRRIARAIVRARPITTTAQLARTVSAAAPAMKPAKGARGKKARHFIHPATRTFQALRIHVNGELDEIRALLELAPGLLKPRGRLVVISFHSLEDRLVKDAFKEAARLGIYEVLTRKPVTATEEEAERNPRARSAKLRAAERTALVAKVQAAG